MQPDEPLNTQRPFNFNHPAALALLFVGFVGSLVGTYLFGEIHPGFMGGLALMWIGGMLGRARTGSFSNFNMPTPTLIEGLVAAPGAGMLLGAIAGLIVRKIAPGLA